MRTLKERLLLMDTIVKAGCLYGVEVWGWAIWDVLERIQGRYVKMVFRENANNMLRLSKMCRKIGGK